MKRINWPLLLGGIILVGILILMVFPDKIASKSPYTLQHMRFSTQDNQLMVESAPYPPSKDYIFGSDDLGRDIFSYIVYGTKLTILLGIFMSLGQFFIAIPMAIMGGFGHKSFKSMILQGNIIFSAIPALLISIIILQLDFFVSLSKGYSMLAFVLVITFVGWPKLGKLLMERVEAINQQPFIRGEIAIGKPRRKIATENVLPHLIPEIIILFFMEIARNLSMMMQLGVFSVFIGNLKIIKDSSMGQYSYYNVSFEPEWASMLSTSRNMLTVAPWTVFFPALAFFISVLGFNLFGEGLREIVQKRDSRFIPTIRKILSWDLQKIKKRPKLGMKAYKMMIAVVLILAGVIFSTYAQESSFDYHRQHVKDYEQVVMGTPEAQATVKHIENKMQELGIVPLKDNSYQRVYETQEVYHRLSQSMSMDIGTKRTEFMAGTDFSVLSFDQEMVQGEVYDASRQDLYNIDDYYVFKDKFIVIDTAYYNTASMNYFMETIGQEVPIKGFLLVDTHKVKFEETLVNKRHNGYVAVISRQLYETMIQNPKAVITLAAHTKKIDSQGVDVFGFYEGKDPYLKDEVIVIGLNYNYINNEGKEVLQFNLELMEQLCGLEKSRRSFVFMFLDGTISDKYHGIYAMTDNFPYSPQKVKAYIDLTRITEPEYATLELSLEQAPVTRQFAWSMGHLFEEDFDKKHMDHVPLKSNKIGIEHYYTNTQAANSMFWNRGIATIIIGTKTSGDRTLDELGEIIVEVINKNNY